MELTCECGNRMLHMQDQATMKCWTCGKTATYEILHAKGIRATEKKKPMVMVDPIDGKEIEPELRDVIAHEWRTK